MNQFLLSQRAFSFAIIVGLTAVMLTSYQNCGQAEFSKMASDAPAVCEVSASDVDGNCILDANPALIEGTLVNGKGIVISGTGIPDTCGGLVRSEVTAAPPGGLNRSVSLNLFATNFNPTRWDCTAINPAASPGSPSTVNCESLNTLPGVNGSTCSFSSSSPQTATITCHNLPNSSTANGFNPEYYHVQVAAVVPTTGGGRPSNNLNFQFRVNGCPNVPDDPPPLPDDFTILGILGSQDFAPDRFLGGSTQDPVIRVQRRAQYSSYRVRFEKRPSEEWYQTLGEIGPRTEVNDINPSCNLSNLAPFQNGPDWSDIRLTGCNVNLERVKLFVTGVKQNGDAVEATYLFLPRFQGEQPENPPRTGFASRVLNNTPTGTLNEVIILGVHKPTVDTVVDGILRNENQNPVFQVYNQFRLDPSLSSLAFNIVVRKQSSQQVLCNAEVVNITSMPQTTTLDLPTATCPDTGVFALTSLTSLTDDYEVEISATGMRPGGQTVPFTSSRFRFDVIGPIANGFGLLGIAAAPGEPFARPENMTPPRIRPTTTPVIESENPNPDSPTHIFNAVIYDRNNGGVEVCRNMQVAGSAVSGSPNIAIPMSCPDYPLLIGNYEVEVSAVENGRIFPAMARLPFEVSTNSLPNGALLRIAGIQGADDTAANNEFVGSGLPWVRVEAVNSTNPLNYLPPRFWLTIANVSNNQPGSAYCARTLLTPEVLNTTLLDIQALVKTLSCDTNQGSPDGKEFFAVVEASDMSGLLYRTIGLSPYRFTWRGDDPSMYTVRWASNNPIVIQAPDLGQAAVSGYAQLVLNKAPSSNPIVVAVEVRDGTAQLDSDYRVSGVSASSRIVTFTFPAGQTSMNVPFDVLADLLNENYNGQPYETFELRILSGNGGTPGITIGTPNMQAVHITPANSTLNPLQVNFDPATVISVNAPAQGQPSATVTFTAKLSRPSAVPLNVGIRLNNGTAMIGTDYQDQMTPGMQPDVLNFPANVTSVTYTVNILADMMTEVYPAGGYKNFFGELISTGTTSGLTLGAAKTREVRINQAPGNILTATLQYTDMSSHRAPLASASPLALQIRVNLNRPAPVAVNVGIRAVDGTALMPADYGVTSTPSNYVTIAAGQQYGVFNFNIQPDPQGETYPAVRYENFFIELTQANTTSGVQLAANQRREYRITPAETMEPGQIIGILNRTTDLTADGILSGKPEPHFVRVQASSYNQFRLTQWHNVPCTGRVQCERRENEEAQTIVNSGFPAAGMTDLRFSSPETGIGFSSLEDRCDGTSYGPIYMKVEGMGSNGWVNFGTQEYVWAPCGLPGNLGSFEILGIAGGTDVTFDRFHTSNPATPVSVQIKPSANAAFYNVQLSCPGTTFVDEQYRFAAVSAQLIILQMSTTLPQTSRCLVQIEAENSTGARLAANAPYHFYVGNPDEWLNFETLGVLGGTDTVADNVFMSSGGSNPIFRVRRTNSVLPMPNNYKIEIASASTGALVCSGFYKATMVTIYEKDIQTLGCTLQSGQAYRVDIFGSNESVDTGDRSRPSRNNPYNFSVVPDRVILTFNDSTNANISISEGTTLPIKLAYSGPALPNQMRVQLAIDGDFGDRFTIDGQTTSSPGLRVSVTISGGTNSEIFDLAALLRTTNFNLPTTGQIVIQNAEFLNLVPNLPTIEKSAVGNISIQEARPVRLLVNGNPTLQPSTAGVRNSSGLFYEGQKTRTFIVAHTGVRYSHTIRVTLAVRYPPTYAANASDVGLQLNENDSPSQEIDLIIGPATDPYSNGFTPFWVNVANDAMSEGPEQFSVYVKSAVAINPTTPVPIDRIETAPLHPVSSESWGIFGTIDGSPLPNFEVDGVSGGLDTTVDTRLSDIDASARFTLKGVSAMSSKSFLFNVLRLKTNTYVFPDYDNFPDIPPTVSGENGGVASAMLPYKLNAANGDTLEVSGYTYVQLNEGYPTVNQNMTTFRFILGTGGVLTPANP